MHRPWRNRSTYQRSRYIFKRITCDRKICLQYSGLQYFLAFGIHHCQIFSNAQLHSRWTLFMFPRSRQRIPLEFSLDKHDHSLAPKEPRYVRCKVCRWEGNALITASHRILMTSNVSGFEPVYENAFNKCLIIYI